MLKSDTELERGPWRRVNMSLAQKETNGPQAVRKALKD